jgi:hypothetical protein
MNAQIEIIKTYSNKFGVIGAVYTVAGRKCASFLGRVTDLLAAIKKVLKVVDGRELNSTERGQTGGRAPEAHNGKFRLKFTDRASRQLWTPNAGEIVIIAGVSYIVEGQGEVWTHGKDKSRYCYLVTDAPAAAPAAEPAPKAGPAQVAYAIKLGATNARHMYDAATGGMAFSRAQLEAMTMSEISDLIADIKF